MSFCDFVSSLKFTLGIFGNIDSQTDRKDFNRRCFTCGSHEMPETDDDVGPDVDCDTGDGRRIPFDVRNVEVIGRHVVIVKVIGRQK